MYPLLSCLFIQLLCFSCCLSGLSIAVCWCTSVQFFQFCLAFCIWMQPSLISHIFFCEEYTEILFCLLKKDALILLTPQIILWGTGEGNTFLFVSYAKLSYCFKRLCFVFLTRQSLVTMNYCCVASNMCNMRLVE